MVVEKILIFNLLFSAGQTANCNYTYTHFQLSMSAPHTYPPALNTHTHTLLILNRKLRKKRNRRKMALHWAYEVQKVMGGICKDWSLTIKLVFHLHPHKCTNHEGYWGKVALVMDCSKAGKAYSKVLMDFFLGEGHCGSWAVKMRGQPVNGGV